MAQIKVQRKNSEDVLNFDAVGDDSTDNRTFIQAAISTVATAGGGKIIIPGGTFRVTRVDSGTAYALSGTDNLVIEGVGRGKTVLKLADGQSNFTRVLNLTSLTNVTVRHLTIDGNVAAQLLGTDQMHGVFVDGCTNVLFEDVEFTDTEGDGLYIGYTTASENVRVIDCDFNANGRNGITLGGCNGTLIQGCHFNSDIVAGQIDSEPPGSINVTNTRIIGNHFEANGQFAITTVGVSHLVPSVGWTIEGNIFYGAIHLTDSTKGVFSGNVMIVDGETQAIEMGYTVEDWIIADNYIETTTSGRGIYAYYSDPYYPRRVRVANNTIIAWDTPLRADGVEEFEIRGNYLRLTGNATGHGLFCQATRSMRNLKIDGNTIVNGLDNIQLTRSSTNTITGLVLRGNTFDDDGANPATLRYNVNLVPSAAWLPGLTMGGDNILTAGGTGTYLMPSALALFSLGGLGSGGSQVLSGWGTPEGVVTAGIGSVFLRRDGGASTTWYVKESGTGNTGWAAK